MKGSSCFWYPLFEPKHWNVGKNLQRLSEFQVWWISYNWDSDGFGQSGPNPLSPQIPVLCHSRCGTQSGFLLCCAFGAAFLLTTAVKSGYLSNHSSPVNHLGSRCMMAIKKTCRTGNAYTSWGSCCCRNIKSTHTERNINQTLAAGSSRNLQELLQLYWCVMPAANGHNLTHFTRLFHTLLELVHVHFLRFTCPYQPSFVRRYIFN